MSGSPYKVSSSDEAPVRANAVPAVKSPFSASNLATHVASFGAKLKHQAKETKRGNRSVIELAQRHTLRDKKDSAKQAKIEQMDNTKKNYIIDPDTAYKQGWDVVVLLLVIINLFTIPISMASMFEVEESPFFSTLVDLLFIIDLFLTFMTGYDLTNGERIWNHKMIAENYVYSGWFFIDFVACVPWEILASGFVGDSAEESSEALKYTLLVRALKLPRLLRLGKVFKYLNRFKYAQAWKIIRLLMIMIISAHWIGCLFFFVCELQMADQMSANEPWCWANDDVRTGTGNGRLLIAFHTAFLMLVGENIDPTTYIEYAYTVLALIIGQIISAVVIGNISIVLNNQASMSALYTQKMDRVNESMMTLKLPVFMQTKGKCSSFGLRLYITVLRFPFPFSNSFFSLLTVSFLFSFSPLSLSPRTILPPHSSLSLALSLPRFLSSSLSLSLLPILNDTTVRNFYEYMWNRHRVLESNATFRHDLNPSLRSEVDLFLNRDIVVNNTMFSKVSDSVLIALVVSLKNQVFLEGDYVIRKGEWGSEMFFLLHGKAGARIKNKIVKNYVAGESFGEIALIEDGGRRKCDVMALTNVDLRLLTRNTFDKLSLQYPELKSRMKEQARKYGNKKAKSQMKGAATMLAKNGIAGLFSKKIAPDGPMKASPFGVGGAFGKAKKSTLPSLGLVKKTSTSSTASSSSSSPPSSPTLSPQKTGGLFGAATLNAKQLKDGAKDSVKQIPKMKTKTLDKRFTITSQKGDANYPSLEKMQAFAAIQEEEEDNVTMTMKEKMTTTAMPTEQMTEMTAMFEQLTKSMTLYQKETNDKLSQLTRTLELLVQKETMRSVGGSTDGSTSEPSTGKETSEPSTGEEDDK